MIISRKNVNIFSTIWSRRSLDKRLKSCVYNFVTIILYFSSKFEKKKQGSALPPNKKNKMETHLLCISTYIYKFLKINILVGEPA